MKPGTGKKRIMGKAGAEKAGGSAGKKPPAKTKGKTKA